jgi:hypothetical protein
MFKFTFVLVAGVILFGLIGCKDSSKVINGNEPNNHEIAASPDVDNSKDALMANNIAASCASFLLTSAITDNNCDRGNNSGMDSVLTAGTTIGLSTCHAKVVLNYTVPKNATIYIHSDGRHDGTLNCVYKGSKSLPYTF